MRTKHDGTVFGAGSLRRTGPSPTRAIGLPAAPHAEDSSVTLAPAGATAGHRLGSRGQSLTEFAIVFPIFMLLLGGIIQFGIIFWGQNTLTQVVRDTGRWAATQQQCTDPEPIIATANQIAAQSSLIGYAAGSWTSTDVTVGWTGTPCPPTSNQEVAWVTISVIHQVPIFFPWIPGNGSISSTTEFRMEPAPR